MEDEKSEIQYSKKTKFSQKAVLAFIFAILGPFSILGAFYPDVVVRNLCVIAPAFLAVLAIICGILGLQEIKASNGKLKGKGYAISGIVIPPLLFVLFIIMLMPALGRVKYILWRMTCENNMKVIGKAMLIYNNDSDQLPNLEKWCDILIEDCNVPIKEFHCPMAEEGPCNYALNKYIAGMKPINDPDIVVFFETQPGWNQVGGPEILTTEYHEGDGCNIVFLDGHTEFIYTRNLHKLKWKPDE